MERPEVEHATAELKSFDPVADLIAAAAASGSTIAVTFSVYPPGDKPGDQGDDRPRPEAGEEAPREEARSTYRSDGSTMHAVRELFVLEQRVTVPHLGVEGVVDGITNWSTAEPDYYVRWCDNGCRQRGGWFKRDEIRPL